MPGWVTFSLAVVGGFFLQYLYVAVARRRWGASWADPVTVILYRCEVDASWTQADRLLHGALWFLKKVGFALIVMGLGFLGFGLLGDRSLLK